MCLFRPTLGGKGRMMLWWLCPWRSLGRARWKCKEREEGMIWQNSYLTFRECREAGIYIPSRVVQPSLLLTSDLPCMHSPILHSAHSHAARPYYDPTQPNMAINWSLFFSILIISSALDGLFKARAHFHQQKSSKAATVSASQLSIDTDWC